MQEEDENDFSKKSKFSKQSKSKKKITQDFPEDDEE